MDTGIKGFGFYIPEKRVSAKELGKNAGMHEKVIEYIGIDTVSEANEKELPSEMGVKAAEKAIKDANITPLQIDVIINCPAGLQDYIIPPISGYIQDKIGAKNAYCFDIVQGCCGMMTGLQIAKNFILSNDANTVLLISSDKWSAYTNYHSAEAVIFGDGAGAIIVNNNCENFFIKDFVFKTEGKFYNLYGIKEGGVKNLEVKSQIKYECLDIEMARGDFKKIYMPSFLEVIKKLLNKNRLKISDISYISMVNANLKLLEIICSELNFSLEKTSADYLKEWGHIGGFDIFFNIRLAEKDGKIKKGDKIILLNAGIGFTWGACLIQY